MADLVEINVATEELRRFFDVFELEEKAQEGSVKKTVIWEAKMRPGSQVVEYHLNNGWRIAVAHRWRQRDGTWSTSDPKAIWLDDARLYKA
jgi:hypothetical protein